MKRLALALPSLLLLASCGAPPVASTGPAHVEIPAYDGMPPAKKKAAPARQSPPSGGATKEAPFPKVARSKLANGLGLAVVSARTLPLVHMRVVVKAGSAYGAAPGLGDLTAEMLKNGGTRALSSAELLRRVETLGSDLSITTRADSTTVGLVVTKDKAVEGLGLLAQVVREPRFDEGELTKYKARLVDQTEDQLRSSGRFTAGFIAWHELYGASHPYAMRDALPAQIAKLDRAAVLAHHRRFFVPANATLVLAGDVDEELAKDLAQKAFGGWTGGAAPKLDFAEPKAPERTRVVVAHRPKSAQSDVFVVLLAPERHAREWPALRVATQILGGGVASRLFGDVREQRSLAYAVSASISEVAHGKQPLMLYAGTQSAKTTEAVLGLLENAERMASNPPSAQETETARRYLSDSFAITMETVGAIASLVGTQEALGLPADYWDEYRRELRGTGSSEAGAAARLLYTGADKRALVVVSGDADAIGQDLTRFGEVTVVDPEKEFRPIKKLEPKK